MIWEMMGDAPSPHSLLNVIEQNIDSPAGVAAIK
jgi:hypothetical protein